MTTTRCGLSSSGRGFFSHCWWASDAGFETPDMVALSLLVVLSIGLACKQDAHDDYDGDKTITHVNVLS
jgi:hypothetical protein